MRSKGNNVEVLKVAKIGHGDLPTIGVKIDISSALPHFYLNSFKPNLT